MFIIDFILNGEEGKPLPVEIVESLTAEII